MYIYYMCEIQYIMMLTHSFEEKALSWISLNISMKGTLKLAHVFGVTKDGRNYFNFDKTIISDFWFWFLDSVHLTHYCIEQLYTLWWLFPLLKCRRVHLVCSSLRWLRLKSSSWAGSAFLCNKLGRLRRKWDIRAILGLGLEGIGIS